LHPGSPRTPLAFRERVPSTPQRSPRPNPATVRASTWNWERRIIRKMTASAPRFALRSWIAPPLLPVVNLALALLLSGLLVLAVGENPAGALWLLASGAFGSAEAIGYTLYYATSFVFTGLAVAVAFHAGLFNIGAEGQAYLGGLAVALLCLGAGGWPTTLVVAAAIVVAAGARAGWGFRPAGCQGRG